MVHRNGTVQLSGAPRWLNVRATGWPLVPVVVVRRVLWCVCGSALSPGSVCRAFCVQWNVKK